MSEQPNLLVHQSRGHSRISPSGLGTLAICPHFQNDNSRPEHTRTTEGTQIHNSLEIRNLKALPEHLRPIAQIGLDFWDKLRAENPSWREELEPCIQVTEEMKGHLDVLRLGESQALILDYKTGLFKQATAKNNAQMKAYTLGVFKRHPEIQEVTVYLAYLRLQEVDYETFTRSQMDQLELDVLSILRRAQAAQRNEIQAHNPDPAACTWCAKAGTCPALNALAVPTAQAYAKARPEDLAIPEAYDPALISDPDTMSKALTVAGIMERWCDSVKHYALQMRMEHGMEIPGTTLSSRKGRSTILNAHEAYKIAESHGLSHDEIMSAVEVSATKLKDAIEDKAPRGKKKLASTALEDELVEAGVLQVGNESFYLRKTK